MILRRNSRDTSGSSASILGLKVVGGKILENGMTGAIIEKVKKGSIADVEGQLRPGDEVIEWNGRSLQGKSSQEVAEIIAESRQEANVELIVSRTMGSRRVAQASWRQSAAQRGTTEPMWNQTFVYSGLRRADLRLRALEITVWDYVRYGANDFLGEAIVELWPLENQPTWRTLGPHEEIALTPSEHLSPPSTGSRFSDSDTPSECDIEGGRDRRNADGASVSSVGSSTSPPRESERRSRRDQETMQAYHMCNNNRKTGMVGHRSHSAAPCDSPSVHLSRSRSKSPRRSATDHRSLSPPDVRLTEYTPTTYKMSRFQSRSATATPTGSPKKRQLPQVPQALARALQERVSQDLEGTSISTRNRMRYMHTYRSTGSGWERRYSGLSDSDLANHSRFNTRRCFSPEKERERDPLGLVDFDSDMESVASVTSSAFSTQSERPRGTRGLGNKLIASNPDVTNSPKNNKAKNFKIRNVSNQTSHPEPKHNKKNKQLNKSVTFSFVKTYHPVETPPDTPNIRRLLPVPVSCTSSIGENDSEPCTNPEIKSARGVFSGDGCSDVFESFQETFSTHFPDCSCENEVFLKEKFLKYESKDSSTTENKTPIPDIENPASDLFPYVNNKRRSSILTKTAAIDKSSDNSDLSTNDEFSDNNTPNNAISPPLVPSSLFKMCSVDNNSSASQPSNDTKIISTEYGYRTMNSRGARERDHEHREPIEPLDPHHNYHLNHNQHHHHHHHHHHHRESSVKRGQFTRSLSNTEPPVEEKTDGSLSDTAVSHLHGLEVPQKDMGRKDGPRDRDRDRTGQFVGLSKKSNSTSQLSATDIGVHRKRVTSTVSSIQRSQEVVPSIPTRSSDCSQRASSLNSISSSEGSSWSPSLRLTAAGEGQLAEFIEGLGPGQLVGRQVLGSPSLGDIQLALCHQKGFLEVEVVRARDLQSRAGSKVLPAPYVKVYLVNGKKCIAKAKTTTSRRTLDPWYQQQLAFKENIQGCILQVTVWGDYGRLEGKKIFMGVAQIMLDDLNLKNIVEGWYKLFGTTSLVSGAPSLGLSSRGSSASLDSIKL
ncbi:unnamed protein product [Diabrotica balteata]|uniref:Regulating synaptic membrane exocytosis protein 2 n=1 Tax=Diabrotica balteata TaxID=107213 RepID=A0A9N9T1P3_DIABA|nr:unnamed protein product [Diabrotica balteata]